MSVAGKLRDDWAMLADGDEEEAEMLFILPFAPGGGDESLETDPLSRDIKTSVRP